MCLLLAEENLKRFLSKLAVLNLECHAMASVKPEKCYTCFDWTDNFIRINEQDGVDGEDLQEIFAIHFWFTKNQFHNKPVCTPCRDRIDDFHRFYCNVKRMHSVELLEVKEELSDEMENGLAAEMEDEEDPNRIVSEFFADAYKVEACSSDEEDDKGDKGEAYVHFREKKSSDSESEVPLAKRKAKRKSQKETVLTKRFPFSYSCKLCVDAGVEKAKPFASFYSLNKHFREVHKSPVFVMCCGHKYTSRSGLRHHLKKHASMPKKNVLHRCFDCNMYFLHEKGLSKHMFLIHTPEDQKQYKCDLCLKAFADEELLKIHMNWHFQVQQKEHYCAECDQYFINAAKLVNHNEKHHQTAVATKPDPDNDASNDSDQSESESKVKVTPEFIAKREEIIHKVLTLNCSVCGAVADTFQLLKKHGQEAHGLKSMTIICCERRFSRRSRLYEHCLFHLKPDAFTCERCNKQFTDSYALKTHKWYVHTPPSERPFKCDICGHTFVKGSYLKQHIQRHVKQERKKLQCQQCDGALYSPLSLRSHMKSQHGEVSDWVCDVCDKRFPHRSTLERHRLTHPVGGLAKIKDQCKICNRWYSNRKSFARHRRLCGVVQPIKCDQCDHTAANDKALKNHKRLRHSGTQSKPHRLSPVQVRILPQDV